MWTYICRTVMFWINFSFDWIWFDGTTKFSVFSDKCLYSTVYPRSLSLHLSFSIWDHKCWWVFALFTIFPFFFFFSSFFPIAFLFLFHTLLLSFPLYYLFFILLLLSFTYSIPFYPSALVPYPFPYHEVKKCHSRFYQRIMQLQNFSWLPHCLTSAYDFFNSILYNDYH